MVGTSENNLKRGKKALEQEARGEWLAARTGVELTRFGRENKELCTARRERNPEKGPYLLCEKGETGYGFIPAHRI